jgi:hypothetical protein
MDSYYSSYQARMQFFTTWPTASEEKAENLSDTGFFHRGELLYIIKSRFITNNYYFLENQII